MVCPLCCLQKLKYWSRGISSSPGLSLADTGCVTAHKGRYGKSAAPFCCLVASSKLNIDCSIFNFDGWRSVYHVVDGGGVLYRLSHLVAHFALMAHCEHHNNVRFNAITS